MDTLNLTSKQLNRLETLNLDKGVTNSEANLYLWSRGNENTQVIKSFYRNDTKMFYNKLWIIRNLIKYQDMMPAEYIIPKRFFALNNTLNGYMMDYVSGTNLAVLLKNEEIPLKEKLNYLKKVLKIIEKTEHIALFNNQIFLGDVHEGNFLLDSKTNKIKVGDLDSMQIAHSFAPVSRYLCYNLCVRYFPYKYPRENHCSRNYRQNHNTTYLSFVYMLLNAIAKDKISILGLDEYYKYVRHLEIVGIPPEVVQALTDIYSNNDNHFEQDYLDEFLTVPEEKLRYYKTFR